MNNIIFKQNLFIEGPFIELHLLPLLQTLQARASKQAESANQ